MLLPTLALFLAPLAPQSTQIEGALALGWESRFDGQIAADDSFADVVIVNGVAYATGSSGVIDTACLTVASDVSTGARLWTSRYDGTPGQADAGGVVCVTPSAVVVGGLTDDNNLTGYRGLLLGLDRSSGAELWSLPIGPISSSFNFSSTACIALELDPNGATIYALAQETAFDSSGYPQAALDRVWALDADTGAVQWTRTAPNINTAQAMALSPDGSQLVITGLGLTPSPFGGFEEVRSSAMAMRVSDGATLWSRNLATNVSLSQSVASFDVTFSSTGLELLVLGRGPGAQDSQLFRLDPLDGSSLWSFEQPDLVLNRVELAPAGQAILAGSQGGQGRVLSLSVAAGTVDWEWSGPVASFASDLELDPASDTVMVAYREGSAEPGVWMLEARELASGLPRWNSTIGDGDPSEDLVDALAIDPAAGVCVAAGTLYDFGEAAQGTLREHRLTDGSLQGELRYDFGVSGDQTVAETALSADGLSHFSAGRLGALATGEFSTGVERRGGWVAAHSTEGGALAWSREFSGPVPSQFTVDQLSLGADAGSVLVAGQYDKDRAHVTSLDAGSGALLWQATLDNHGNFFELVGDLKPAPSAGLILAATYSGVEMAVVALDASTGAQVWSAPFQPIDSNHPPKLQVSPDGSRVYAIASNYVNLGNLGDVAVACLDTADGTILWFQLYDWDGLQPFWDGDYAKDSVLSADGADLYVFGQTQPNGSFNTGASVWIRIDAQTGAPQWFAVSETGIGEGLAPRLVALSPDGSRVYGLSTLWRDFGGGDFDLLVEARDAQTGQLVWSSNLFTGYLKQFNGYAIGVTPDSSAVVIAAGTDATSGAPDANGLTAAFNALTGEPIWSSILEGAGPFAEESRAIQFTPDGRRALVASQSSLSPLHRDLVLQEMLLPSLTGVPSQLSAADGGTHSFELSGGIEQAGQNAILLGSLAGTAPGFPLSPDLTLPLVLDGYTNFTLLNYNSATLTNTLSVLDAAGHSSASLNLAPGAFPILVGQTLYHAWVGFSVNGFTFVSNPATLDVIP